MIRVDDVTAFARDPERVVGCHLDEPCPGDDSEGFALGIRGWVLARAGAVERVELRLGATVLAELPADLPRPDVAAAHPGQPGADRCGFEATLGTVGLPLDSNVLVVAVDADGLGLPIAMCTLQRRALAVGYRMRLAPLLLTMLGRTGSTWMMRLLSFHPEIVVHTSQHYETRAGTYWMHMLKVLAEPESQPYLREPPGHFHVTDDLSLRAWFAERYVEQAADFCLHGLDQFYAHVMTADDREHARYFAEKYHPDHAPVLAWELCPDTRELFLIRDPRDMLCSIRSINTKRGSQDFGRANADSELDYVVGHFAREVRIVREAFRARRERALLIRYEDLILDPVPTLERVLAYAELDARPSTIERMLRLAATDTDELAFHRTTTSPRASIGRWVSDLDPELVLACENRCADALEELGYGLSTPGRVPIAA